MGAGRIATESSIVLSLALSIGVQAAFDFGGDVADPCGFTAWFEGRGGKVNGVEISMIPLSDGDVRRGVVTNRPVTEGEVLVNVPGRLLMKATDVFKQLRPFVVAEVHANNQEILVWWLALQSATSFHSAWGPYICMMPSPPQPALHKSFHNGTDDWINNHTPLKLKGKESLLQSVNNQHTYFQERTAHLSAFLDKFGLKLWSAYNNAPTQPHKKKKQAGKQANAFSDWKSEVKDELLPAFGTVLARSFDRVEGFPVDTVVAWDFFNDIGLDSGAGCESSPDPLFYEYAEDPIPVNQRCSDVLLRHEEDGSLSFVARVSLSANMEVFASYVMRSDLSCTKSFALMYGYMPSGCSDLLIKTTNKTCSKSMGRKRWRE